MNDYFYLNEEKQPQGPHTLDELRALMATGKLTEHTLAAPRGGSGWVSLASLLENPQPPVPQNCSNTCPRCASELLCSAGNLPELCPTCSYCLRAANPHDLWQNFLLALRKTFVLKGRATRMEFWSFILFAAILSFVVQSVIETAGVACITAFAPYGLETPEHFHSTTIAALLALTLVIFLFNIAITIPQVTVTIRRLHDVGRSGKWLLANLLLLFVAMGSLVGYAGTQIYIEEQICRAEESTMPGEEVHEPEWDKQGLQEALPVMLWGGSLSLGLAGLTALYILILCIKDSDRGPNRYGPSAKYPTA